MVTSTKADRTNYFQSVGHMIKGNLGAGVLGLPMAFKHLGWVSAGVLLPVICIISTYCVHTLARSSRKVGKHSEGADLSYSLLARRSFELGPVRLRRYNKIVGWLLDTALMVTQIGIGCVYMVFVVDNLTSILATYQIVISKSMVFLAIFPLAVGLGCIRTLNRLAIASLVANMLQAVGLTLIIEYLLRDSSKMSFQNRAAFAPWDEMALGLGSVMFAFEGISVVLPVYNRIKARDQFGSFCGVINVAYLVNLLLYFWLGLLGYLRFGDQVRDSITLNLPAEPLYDSVRALFTCSILLTYPLQLYVPNELIWGLVKESLIKRRGWDVHGKSQNGLAAPTCTIGPLKLLVPQDTQESDKKTCAGIAQTASLDATSLTEQTANTFPGILTGGKSQVACLIDGLGQTVDINHDLASRWSKSVNIVCDPSVDGSQHGDQIPAHYEYYSRMLVVLTTFVLAVSVPHLNLLMDFLGSFSGVFLCLFVPSIIHLVSFWESWTGFKKVLLVALDLTIVVFSVWASLLGSYFSALSIFNA